MKTFVYGDSFSNAEYCKCPQDKMWYAPFVAGELVDRTRASSSTEEMFLLATNDAVTNSHSRFILGTGMMYSRLMLYTDDLYNKEQVRKGQLQDCLKFFSTQFLRKKSFVFESLHISMFHHTLVWSKYLSNIVLFHSLMTMHQHTWLAVHMHTDRKDYQSPAHPLVLPLLKQTAAMPNYVDQRHSCHSVCKDAGIKPMDYAEYSWHGHHTQPGQQHFASHVNKLITDRNIF